MYIFKLHRLILPYYIPSVPLEVSQSFFIFFTKKSSLRMDMGVLQNLYQLDNLGRFLFKDNSAYKGVENITINAVLLKYLHLFLYDWKVIKSTISYKALLPGSFYRLILVLVQKLLGSKRAISTDEDGDKRSTNLSQKHRERSRTHRVPLFYDLLFFIRSLNK